MSGIDDIDIGPEGEAGGVAAVAAALECEADAAGKARSPTCLSCGAPMAGVFCAACGQKNDDMRRSSFMLARNFFEDTFGFDSRMWRTLGLMAVRPGTVPKDFAHGRRSRFTPPVRLFLVVSFLFFLTIALTNTLFAALDLEFKDPQQASGAENGAVVIGGGDEQSDCGFAAKLKFFIKESALDIDSERVERCFGQLRRDIEAEIENPEANDKYDVDAGNDPEGAKSLMARIAYGVSWATSNPRAFNSSLNSWLPRVMFLMTPVLALILTLFIRGKDALIFDHLVMSFYIHAAGFAIIAVCLVVAQLGLPYIGVATFVLVAGYYVTTLKRTYGRGWVKTVWTALASGLLYQFVLISAMMAIVWNIIWNAAG